MKVEAAVVPSLVALLAPLVTHHLQSQLLCLDLVFLCTTKSLRQAPNWASKSLYGTTQNGSKSSSASARGLINLGAKLQKYSYSVSDPAQRAIAVSLPSDSSSGVSLQKMNRYSNLKFL